MTSTTKKGYWIVKDPKEQILKRIRDEDIVLNMMEKSDYSVFLQKELGFSEIVFNFKQCYEIAKKKLKKFDDKVIFVKKKSEDVAGDIPENIDFIYIDGNYAYDYVKKDVELYFPKLKKGGVIGSHDFMVEYPGVAKAVLEFSERSKLKINGVNYDWQIIKE